jgi:hypothetical protein
MPLRLPRPSLTKRLLLVLLVLGVATSTTAILVLSQQQPSTSVDSAASTEPRERAAPESDNHLAIDTIGAPSLDSDSAGLHEEPFGDGRIESPAQKPRVLAETDAPSPSPDTSPSEPPASYHAKPSPTSLYQVPTPRPCNTALKAAETNLYRARVAAEQARHDRAIDRINGEWVDRGAYHSGGRIVAIEEENQYHQRHLTILEHDYAAQLTAINCR